LTNPTIAFAMSPERTRFVVPSGALERLEAIGRILSRDPIIDFADESAKRMLAETDILITGWGCPRLDSAVLRQAPGLRLVSHAAGTVRGLIDPDFFDTTVKITHAAQANAVPVAEFTLAAIILAGKRAFRFRNVYSANRNLARVTTMQGEPIGNYGRTIGIVGASRIGRLVIEMLRPLSFHVLLFDPLVSAEEARALGVSKVDLDLLMTEADIVSLHVPLLPGTRHMIGGGHLALMKDGATLINTARGGIVDQAALLDILKSGRVDAIIDVTDPEIPNANSPFYDLPNVFLTPHIAGAIGLERARLGETAVDEVIRYVEGRPMLYEICKADMERIA
jgi:phosphoglycerate dehydrogenase-like enzyme